MPPDTPTPDLSRAIQFTRDEQLRCAAEIARDGWDEHGAALGLADWFAEDFLLTAGRR